MINSRDEHIFFQLNSFFAFLPFTLSTMYVASFCFYADNDNVECIDAIGPVWTSSIVSYSEKKMIIYDRTGRPIWNIP